MILLPVNAEPGRSALCSAFGSLIVALLAWPGVVAAEPADGSRTLRAAPEQAELTSAQPVPRLELNYPAPRPTLERTPVNSASLHLELHPYATREKLLPSTTRDEPFRRALSEWAYPRSPLLNPFWSDPGNAPPAVVGTQMRLANAEDERSWWARWHSSIWGVSVSVGALMFGMVAALSLLPQDVSGWNKPNFYGLKRTFSSGPSFDYDHYYFNYLAHPYDGSEFYLVARNREFTWWQSFLYAAAVSSAFEFVIESAYEGASWQDLWITPVSGAVIGELRWQAKKALEDPNTGKPVGTTNKILHVVVDPLDAIFNL